jgi:predicted Holliday junction resolvase-like endonuclease
MYVHPAFLNLQLGHKKKAKKRKEKEKKKKKEKEKRKKPAEPAHAVKYPHMSETFVPMLTFTGHLFLDSSV